jgi:predicted Zn-dependent protease with MMP-like domain
VPWLTPSFTWRERVGQGPGPGGAGESVGEAGAVGADDGDDAGAPMSVGAGDVLPPAVVLEALPHPVAITAAQVSATAGRTRRARSRGVSITVSLYMGRLREPCDSYDAAAGSPVAPFSGRDNGCMILIEPERFEEMVVAALDGLPEQLGEMMRNVAVTVEHGPGPRGLLGLYQGVPLTSRTTQYSGVLPDRIIIYRLAICAICRTEDEVADQVRRTVVHEVGHHFGIDDERLRELGW